VHGAFPCLLGRLPRSLGHGQTVVIGARARARAQLRPQWLGESMVNHPILSGSPESTVNDSVEPLYSPVVPIKIL
jgi:hypothetical protein